MWTQTFDPVELKVFAFWTRLHAATMIEHSKKGSNGWAIKFRVQVSLKLPCKQDPFDLPRSKGSLLAGYTERHSDQHPSAFVDKRRTSPVKDPTFSCIFLTDASFMYNADWRWSVMASISTSVCIRWCKEGALMVSRSIAANGWDLIQDQKNCLVSLSSANNAYWGFYYRGGEVENIIILLG